MLFVKGEIMNLGNKIVSLRKKKNITQEELAEKIGVTRQTISKWELAETTPDINQAKMLSKVFGVSLDELTDNDINNVLVEKVSNTERLAGIIIKLLKVLGISLIVFVLAMIIIVIIFNINNISFRDNKVVGKTIVSCVIDDNEYLYEVEYNKNFLVINEGGDSWIVDHIDIEEYDNANKVIAHIEDYFKEHNGSCKITNEDK